jgi:hypothetical protein
MHATTWSECERGLWTRLKFYRERAVPENRLRKVLTFYLIYFAPQRNGGRKLTGIQFARVNGAVIFHVCGFFGPIQGARIFIVLCAGVQSELDS